MITACIEEPGITPVQYARAKGLTLNYVYGLIWIGALPAKKMFGRWFISPDAISERPKRDTDFTAKAV
jgi:hypothetical protein